MASYGRDLKEDIGLIDLLEKINEVDGIERIRLGSLEPMIITEEFIKRLSKLEKICVETYEKLTGKKPIIMAIHAGLECGLLLDKMPHAQAISLGPDMFEVHTPNEHLNISSTKRTWDYLVAILKGMNQY